jgi:L-2,4-diaminobutyrate decarboxylase
MSFLAPSAHEPSTRREPPAGSGPAAAQLLGGETADRYRVAVTDGVRRVARRLAAADRPFTGVTPQELRPLVDAVDLDRPVHDRAAALD